MPLVLGIPSSILDLQQKGLLERAFHDGLYPALQYRSEALFEEWPMNTGEEVFMSRPGLLTPITEELVPGKDPEPQANTYEQWIARLGRYGGAKDTHMPTSATANANLFLRDIQQLGLQAGQSLNRIPRNALFSAYLGGNTNLTAATLVTDTNISVAALNGFTEVVIPSASPRPAPVSPGAPKSILVGTVTRNIVGAIPNDPNTPYGPGTLILDAAIGAVLPARTPVLAADRSVVVRSGGGDSVDAIAAADTFVLQDAINSANDLRNDTVPPHDDGFYHAHISPGANSQVFADPVFQRLNEGLPEGMHYKQGFIGTIGGVAFFMNTEAPTDRNSGTNTATGASSVFSKGIGAETVNAAGVRIGRILVTGKGALYERGLDETKYISEAGITGKVGEFQVVNQGIAIATERVRLILRAPQDRLQDIVSSAWSISTSFPIPSDITATSSPARYKRCRVIEHAL